MSLDPFVKRTLIVVGVVIGILILWNVVSRLIPSYTEYRGEKIKLARYYFDFDEFKNDPDNIDPSETSRVQRLVTEAPIGKSYATREEMIHATFDIVFPGYGTGGLGDGREEGEGALSGESIEIPRADKMRYIVFQHRGGKYVLVDDFVESDIPVLVWVHQEKDKLVYTSDNGQRKLTRVPRYQ